MFRHLFIAAVLFCATATYVRADEPAHVLASADHEVGGVKVELLEVKRDSPTVVTVRWRYRNETDEAKQLTKQRTGSVDAYRLALNSYLLDQTKRIKYPLSRDTDREPVASRNGEPNHYITVGPKATINVWAKYIVPESTKRVAVAIEGVSPFENIEISH
jgi:hypothetical protein